MAGGHALVQVILGLLRESPLLLLFVVAALGAVIGHISIGGFRLGVAAVLFVGLAANAYDPALVLPPFTQELGLVLFVYTIGLTSGSGFFAAFRARGARDAALVFGLVGAAAALLAAAGKALRLAPGTIAGVLCGALTNTPALAAVTEHLRDRGATPAEINDPIVGYSIAYPAGVFGVLLALFVLKRRAAADPPASLRSTTALVNRTVRVTSADAIGKPAEALRRANAWDVVFSRHRRGDIVETVTDVTVLAEGDRVTIVGRPADVDRVARQLGEIVDEPLDLDRSVVDFRRIFVSSPEVIGKRIGDLGLDHRFGAQLTRVRRGEVEVLADDDLVLQAGDHVRVVAPRARIAEVSKFFGDSFRILGEVDVLTLGIGIALGVVVGTWRLRLSQDLVLGLGLAGGPLLVGLVLGWLGKSGPLVWSMPYSANLTIRQLGLVLFFAGVGTRAGATFVATLRSGASLAPLGLGAAITIGVAFATIGIGRWWLKTPSATVAGMTAGLHTQPAALSFANDAFPGDAPNQGYAALFPLATIAKILIAQALIALLR